MKKNPIIANDWQTDPRLEANLWVEDDFNGEDEEEDEAVSGLPTCPNCNGMVRPSNRFCRRCGQSLQPAA